MVATSPVEKERPGPALVALRAATLGVDDLSRKARREWLLDGLNHNGHPLPDWTSPTEPSTVAIAAAVMTLEPRERAAYRQWVRTWTDYTGRIITPDEHARRLKEIGLPPQREPEKRSR